jgi:hypothetical protein
MYFLPNGLVLRKLVGGRRTIENARRIEQLGTGLRITFGAASESRFTSLEVTTRCESKGFGSSHF